MYREWSDETFGLNNLDESVIIAKFQEEAQEFIENPSPDEAADVLMLLFDWCSRNKIDLEGAFLKKLDYNKKRVFTLTEDGIFKGTKP